LLERLFHLTERGTTAATEVRAGVATFLTMAYILFVNPQILSQAGMPAEDVAVATAVASAVAILVMAFYANYPFALAPGMGLNAYFTFSVVVGMGVSYQTALAAVFVEGLLFLALALGGVRTSVLNAIPMTLKAAVTSGIGLFLTIIGFQNAGLVVPDEATLVALGDLGAPSVLLALAGLALIGVLLARGLKGSILLGIVAVTVASWLVGTQTLPESFFSVPHLPEDTMLSFDFTALFTAEMISVVLAFLFVDFLDTAGTLIGVGKAGGFLDEKGNLPKADRAFTADAVGTVVGALLGTSTVTSYIESATGIEEGGRTGLTALVVAVLFLLSLFVAPLFTAIPAAATAPALIVVGALMMKSVREVQWECIDEALPAFLTIAAMPLTYSIANGIVFGLLSYVVLKTFSGRRSEVHPILYALAGLIIAYLAFVGAA
jgi:AGZA family xanthine/uracil permease-like MFS transporter